MTVKAGEWLPKDKVCIVGIGETEYTRWGQIKRPEFQLACEAILKAIDDAGLKVTDIDGICAHADDRNRASMLATALGIPQLRFANMVWGAGGGGTMASQMNASMAVATGTANYVVAFRALAQGQFGRIGTSRVGAAARMPTPAAFATPWGCMTAGQSLAAMQARRHMHLYGTTSRHYGNISVAAYKHAQRNPRAVMYGRPITIEDHQNSRYIDWPLHLYDYCQESDCSAAAVYTTAERAKDLKHRPVYVVAAAQGTIGRQAATFNADPYCSAKGETVARDLWARSGLTPKDINVAQTYENFTPNVLHVFEDFGFCKKGEGGPFTEGGRLEWPDGEFPINTSGGNLAEAYVHGFELVNEAVRQMRGTSTCQVEGAELCLCTSMGSVELSSCMIVRR